MTEQISHEDLVAAGEERMAEYQRTAPRCRWCQERPGWWVLDGLCPTCRVAWAKAGKG